MRYVTNHLWSTVVLLLVVYGLTGLGAWLMLAPLRADWPYWP